MDKDLVLKNNVREARIKKGISQEELAQTVGTSRQTIVAIERNNYNPTAKLAFLISIALDKSFEELFFF